MRLDKLLAHSGFGSRKEVKKFITSGLVTVNHHTEKNVGLNINPEIDSVSVMGEEIVYREFYYIMLNKPQGVVSATEDNHYKTVTDLVAVEFGHIPLFPVGRLDIDTTGLLLLTNNGNLAHQLLSPKKRVTKKYLAEIDGYINSPDIKAFEEGIDLGDFVTLPAVLKVIEEYKDSGHSFVEVEIKEGKFHQVKRMFQALEKNVLRLHRQSMGPLELDSKLDIGAYRPLNTNEMNCLKPYGLK